MERADRDASWQTPAVAALLADVAGMLRARGERMTRQRRAVLVALADGDGHVGAERIVEDVARIDPSVHRASVYRALETLSDLGVVQHVHVGHGGTAYHLVHGRPEHPHAQCHACGRVLDLPADLLDGAASRLRSEHGFVLDAGHVALSGTCDRCDRPA